MPREPTKQLPVIGWREWVRLPDLLSTRIKAKLDSGARSSSLHAFDIELFEVDGQPHVRFKIHPIQRSLKKVVCAEAKVLEFRQVKSSNGQVEQRPVIQTTLSLLGESWPIELSLNNREDMGFRMLIGREAFRGRFFVDAGSSYYGGKPKKKPKPK